MRYNVVICALLYLLASTEAHGFQPNKSCPSLPKDPVQAQILAGELFSAAEQQYTESRPMKALEGFLCSHHIIRHENTLFNIAQIAKISQLRDAALEMLKDYVRHVKRSTKADPIRDIIAEIEAEEASASAPETASEPKTEEAAPTHTPQENLVSLSSVFGDPNQAQEETKDTTNIKKILSFVLMGTGGAALVTGGAMQGLVGRSQGIAQDTDKYSKFKSESDKMDFFQKFAIAGFVNGGVLLGAGIALFILSGKDEQESDITVSAWSHGLTIQGRF